MRSTRGTAPSGATPLPEVRLHSAGVLDAFLRSLRPGIEGHFAECGGLLTRGLLTADGRAAVSLAIDLAENGSDSPLPVLPLLAMAFHAYDPGPFAVNTLRIGSRVWELDGDTDISPIRDYGPRGAAWAGRVVSAVRGLAASTDDPISCRISTEEELAASTAVVRFVVKATLADRGHALLRSATVHGDWQDGEQQTRIADPELEALVREGPGDNDRILSGALT